MEEQEEIWQSIIQTHAQYPVVNMPCIEISLVLRGSRLKKVHWEKKLN